MLEIWSDLQDRIDRELPLSDVQTIVVREWLNLARARAVRLELDSQHGMLSNEKYAELAALRQEIDRMAGYG